MQELQQAKQTASGELQAAQARAADQLRAAQQQADDVKSELGRAQQAASQAQGSLSSQQVGWPPGGPAASCTWMGRHRARSSAGVQMHCCGSAMRSVAFQPCFHNQARAAQADFDRQRQDLQQQLSRAQAQLQEAEAKLRNAADQPSAAPAPAPPAQPGPELLPGVPTPSSVPGKAEPAGKAKEGLGPGSVLQLLVRHWQSYRALAPSRMRTPGGAGAHLLHSLLGAGLSAAATGALLAVRLRLCQVLPR